ncbi:MAG: cadherin-like beta sandwich domain-containing protein, partial [Dehalococcoidia bacterium]
MGRWPLRGIAGVIACLALSVVLSAPARAEDDAPSNAPAPAPSADATLAALALSAGELAPAFAPDVLAYTAAVDHPVDAVAATATPADA